MPDSRAPRPPEPSPTFDTILGGQLKDARPPSTASSTSPPWWSRWLGGTSSEPPASGDDSKPGRKRLRKPHPPSYHSTDNADDHWRGVGGTQGSGFAGPELRIAAGVRLHSTREDIAYHEKHFGDTYTAGWARVRSTIRNTLSTILNPICLGPMKGYLDSALTATLGPPQMTGPELATAVQDELVHPNAERTRTAMGRAASSPTAIDELIDKWQYHYLRRLEEVADRYSGQVGSAVRSRIRHSVATRMGRDPDWTASVSVLDTLADWESHWVAHRREFRTPNPSAGDFIAYLKKKADSLEKTGHSDLVSCFMAPCDPAEVEATRAQARLEDTQEWESLTFVMGVPMRLLGLARSVPSMVSSWFTKSTE